MQWYLPITILPAVALIILSTTNILISLNEEIQRLEDDENCSMEIINAKLLQLKIVSFALVGAYISAFFMVLAGLVAGVQEQTDHMLQGAGLIMVIGVCCLAISIILMMTFAIRGVSIRMRHLKLPDQS